jgi:hypothetical protein
LRKRLIAVSASLFMLGIGALGSMGGTGISSAKAGDAGSPGNKGLCNAYAHNNQHAKEHGQSFARLAETAGDYDEDGDRDAADVTSYCADNVPAVGQPG